MPEIAVSAEDLVRLAEELDEIGAFLAGSRCSATGSATGCC
jgi:hypothetical protein